MYELIKSVSKREVETVIRPAIASAPIDGTRLAVWGATVASDNGHANSHFIYMINLLVNALSAWYGTDDWLTTSSIP